MRYLLRVATVATLAAGLVGLWRQRREAVSARARGAPPRRPAGLADAPQMGSLATHLATWVPERPATAWGRLASAVWALPLTLTGTVLGLVSGGRPRWDERHGCIVFERTAGVSGRVLRAIGARANAMGHVVVVTSTGRSERLLAHEAVHVRQAERLGPLLFVLYTWLAARYGYADHPLERAARIPAAQLDRDSRT